MNDHFGEHLTIDGYGGDPVRLNDRELVREILKDLPAILSMTKLSPPEVYFAPGSGGKDLGGWSGFIIVAESHLSIHTFPHAGFLSADVYTCRTGMDQERIVQYFAERFGLEEIEKNFIKRGLRYTALASAPR